MKRSLAMLLAVLLVLSTAGCRKTPPASDDPTTVPTAVPTSPQEETVSPTQPPSYQIPMTAVSMIPETEAVYAEDNTLLFTHRSQSVALILDGPEAADQVMMDLLSRTDSAPGADTLKRAAVKAYTGQSDWTPYSYSLMYTPVRLDRSIFSLLGEEVSFAGNLHPDRNIRSVTYDLATGRVLSLSDLLAENREDSLLEALLAQALSENPNSGFFFMDCNTIARDVFSAGEADNWYLSPAGLCFYFAPYEIAPYTAGTVTAEIPYAALGGILKSGYFPPEQLPVPGSVTARPFTHEDADSLRQMSEVILQGEGDALLLTSGSIVYDVRLETIDPKTQERRTVFVCEALADGDGVILQADLTGSRYSLLLSYTADEERILQQIS